MNNNIAENGDSDDDGGLRTFFRSTMVSNTGLLLVLPTARAIS